jgi:endogenous inhibitor of DNA gyrase (YacG/DUF329 family)
MACPLCGKPTIANYRPFCSRLCANHDLINWIDGKYAIPASEEESDEIDSEGNPDQEA